ncbi:MAG TPA: hypothetical protein VFH91_02440, partial [Pyrinomonadaceae bacterium]|nr:hypothetical protein [Pyrinomonadaceae bacterium]
NRRSIIILIRGTLCTSFTFGSTSRSVAALRGFGLGERQSGSIGKKYQAAEWRAHSDLRLQL